ncbi:MAG: hypothetical protein ACYC5N_06050 [Endomicrobiales bacterium]
MLKKTLFAALTLLLAGCSSSPQSPRVYVVGVDCSKSFWQTGVTGQRRAASLSRYKVQEVVYKLRDVVSEIKAMTEDGKFIRKTKQSENGFVKEVDKDAIRKEIENTMDLATVLANSNMEEKERLNVSENVRARLNSLSLLLNKRNFVKTPVKASAENRYDEDINTASAGRIKHLIEQAGAVIDHLSYSVSVPEDPQVLSRTGEDIFNLTSIINKKIHDSNSMPMNDEWNKRGVYGNLRSMSSLLFFRIGDQTATTYQPSMDDLNANVRSLVNKSLGSGLKVFYNSSDYKTFFQRSFKEIVNQINGWGEFDRDIGLSLTYVIIGDGKHDPEAKFESSASYDTKLLSEVRDFFAESVMKDVAVSGVSWDNIREIKVKICVPQRRYNTDVFDAWTQMLQGLSKEGKVSVNYYMFENLKDGDVFNEGKVAKLLE